jgi:Na+-driven multidrug efflux pump
LRFKPSPLVEASASFAIAFLIVIAWLFFDRSIAADVIVGASNIAFIFMFPVFTGWALVGLLIRDRSHWFRAIANIAVTLVMLFGISFLVIPPDAQLSDPKVAAMTEQNIRALIVALLANLIAGTLAYIFFIERAKDKKNSTAYRVINTAPSAPNKRKKK